MVTTATATTVQQHAANAADTATTEVGDEENVGEVAAIRDDIKDAIAAAMAALVDYEDNEGW